MKRHPALAGFSREHHHALVLAQRAQRSGNEAQASRLRLAAEIVAAFRQEIEAHFRNEENVLLPPLGEAGQATAVARTLSEHAALREEVDRLAAGDTSGLCIFGELLALHVRFEERELFALAEAVLAPETLARISRQLP